MLPIPVLRNVLDRKLHYAVTLTENSSTLLTIKLFFFSSLVARSSVWYVQLWNRYCHCVENRVRVSVISRR